MSEANHNPRRSLDVWVNCPALGLYGGHRYPPTWFADPDALVQARVLTWSPHPPTESASWQGAPLSTAFVLGFYSPTELARARGQVYPQPYVPPPLPPPPPKPKRFKRFAEMTGPGWGRSVTDDYQPTDHDQLMGQFQLMNDALRAALKEMADLRKEVRGLRAEVKAEADTPERRKAEREREREKNRAASLKRATEVYEQGQKRLEEVAARKERYRKTVAAMCDLIVSYEEFGFPTADLSRPGAAL